MKKRILTIIFILFVFASAVFILNYRSTNPHREKEKLFVLSDSLEVKQTYMRNQLNLLSQLVKSLYLSREYAYEGGIPQNYHLDDENIYKMSNDGLASVFYTGNRPIGDNLIRDVVMLEQIDDFLQKMFIGDQIIESVFYYDNSNFYRYYPFIEYRREFKNYDYRQNPQFKYILEHITKTGIVWLNDPYRSPFSGKWITSIARPVLEGTNLLGLCVINLDVMKMNQFVDSIEPDIGILNTEGIVLHPDVRMAQEFEMPPWITGAALNDTLSVMDYSILNYRNSALNKLGDNIINKRDFFYSQKIYNTDYMIITNEMPTMGIYLYTLVYDDGSVAKMKRLRRKIRRAQEKRFREELPE
ncbi:MAG: PDC sensor domain-containing protein [Candidatus Cloacimonetes bacterium]|nr:PDC sensor domain-containing protein [Candidatus Cloacimonadota bacterium]